MSKPKNKSQSSAKDTGPRGQLSPKAAAAIAAAVVIVVAVVIFRLAFGSGNSPVSVLQQFYEGMYINANVNQMAQCLPEGAVRDDFELVYTMGGVSNLAETNRIQAQEWVGEEMSLTVKIVEQEKPSATALNAARAENSAVESVTDVTFDILLTGNRDSRTLRGQTTLVKIDGQWYLPDYNIYIGFVNEDE